MAPPSRPALVAFVAYGLGCVLLGEAFPFSRYDMYARGSARDAGAVPVFLADGQPVEPSALRSYYGLDPASLRAPEGVACTLGYIVEDRAAWVAAHPADAPGPIRIQVGFDEVRLVDGEVRHAVRVTGEGTAWP